MLPPEQEVVLGAQALHVAIAIQHGGHLVCTVRGRADRILAGDCKLVAPDNCEIAPTFGGRSGRLRANEPSRTTRPVPPGRYDLREHGKHRQSVGIGVAKTTELTIRLP